MTRGGYAMMMNRGRGMLGRPQAADGDALENDFYLGQLSVIG